MTIPRRGMSLVETLVSVTIMGACAIMYGTAWNSNFGSHDAARTLELATELYVRQVSILRRMDPKIPYTSGTPFSERAFQSSGGVYAGGCAPAFPGANQPGTTFYTAATPGPGGGADLSYNTPLMKLLDTPNGNCFEIPTGAPWLPPLPIDMDGLSLADHPVSGGFRVRVFASRVQQATANGLPLAPAALNGSFGPPHLESSHWLNQLIRYRVIVEHRRPPGGFRHVVSGELLVEVR